MSYGNEDMEYINNAQSLPVSVLISGADGNELLEQASQWQSSRTTTNGGDSSSSVLSVRIALRPQSMGTVSDYSTPPQPMTLSGMDSNNHNQLRFPLVRASATMLRIFSKAGWGIQAVQQQETHERAHWHLQLLRHQFDAATDLHPLSTEEDEEDEGEEELLEEEEEEEEEQLLDDDEEEEPEQPEDEGEHEIEDNEEEYNEEEYNEEEYSEEEDFADDSNELENEVENFGDTDFEHGD